MRRLGLVLIVLLLTTVGASAQGVVSGSLGALNTTVVATPGAILGLTIAVSGTYSGTVSFQCDPNGGGTYTNILATNTTDGTAVSSTTSTGNWFVPNAGCLSLQAKMTSYVSGTAVITMTRAYSVARLFSPIVGQVVSGNGTVNAPSYTFVSNTNTGFMWEGSGAVDYVANGTRPLQFNGSLGLASDASLAWSATAGNATAAKDIAVARAAPGELTYTTVVFANLGTPANGTQAFCTDCAPTTPASCPGTKASCVCAGSGVGSLAIRVNATWYCPF